MSEVFLSLGEIDALAAKAARGAGLSWGMAEEAGYACRWLAARGIDGLTALADHLEWGSACGWTDTTPTLQTMAALAGAGWADAGAVRAGPFDRQGEARVLSGLLLGVALCDAVPVRARRREAFRIGAVHAPLLMLPHLHVAWQAAGLESRPWRVGLRWADGKGSEHAIGLLSEGMPRGDIEPAIDAGTVDLTLRIEVTVGTASSHSPVSTPGGIIARLDTFAMRTTVPATEASRAGAGSARSDND